MYFLVKLIINRHKISKQLIASLFATCYVFATQAAIPASTSVKVRSSVPKIHLPVLQIQPLVKLNTFRRPMFILLKSTFNIVFSYNLLCQSVSRRIILIKNIFSAAFTSFACGSRGLDAVKQNALLRVAPYIYVRLAFLCWFPGGAPCLPTFHITLAQALLFLESNSICLITSTEEREMAEERKEVAHCFTNKTRDEFIN